MRFLKGVVTFVWLPLLVITSCSKSKEDIPVAKIKDRVISLATYEKAYYAVDPKFLPESKDLDGRLEFLNTMIDKEVMALKADELGYDKDDFVVRGMDAFKQVGLQAGYLRLKIGDRAEPTEKELKEFFKNYGVNRQIKQILVDTREEADHVYELLQGGADFENVCREYSKGPDAEQGGKVVNALFGTFPPEFQEKLFRVPVGGITEPILSQYGYFVIKVVSERRPQQKRFEDVRDDIMTLVRKQKQIRLTQEMAENVRTKYGFEYYEDNIKTAFEYLPPDRPLTNPPARSAEVYPLLKIRPEDLDKPLVGYKDKFITMKDFSDLYDRASFFQRPRKQYRLGDIRKFLVDIVMNELVDEELNNTGLENEPEIAAMLGRKREQLMVDKLYQDLIDGQTTVRPGEVQDYYSDNLEQFRRPEERRFGVIVMGSRAEADAAYEALQQGSSFNRVKSKFDIEELSKEMGLDDRFFTEGQRPELDKQGFALKRVGDYTEPFETSKGWVIVKLFERRPERILSLSEARPDIIRYLKTLKNEQKLKSLLAKWRKQWPIKVYEKNLMKANLEEVPHRGVSFG